VKPLDQDGSADRPTLDPDTAPASAALGPATLPPGLGRSLAASGDALAADTAASTTALRPAPSLLGGPPWTFLPGSANSGRSPSNAPRASLDPDTASAAAAFRPTASPLDGTRSRPGTRPRPADASSFASDPETAATFTAGWPAWLGAGHPAATASFPGAGR